MRDEYCGYFIESNCRKKNNGRYSVEGTIIKETINGTRKTEFNDIKTSLILFEEAEKESINFGRNLIRRNLIGF